MNKAIRSFILIMLACWPSLAADVLLSWTANTEPDLAGYKVFQGSSPSTYGPPVSIANQNSYTISGLSAGTWYFALKALDLSGNESGFSNEVSALVVGPPPPPADIVPGTVISGFCDAVTSTSLTVDVGFSPDRLLLVGIGMKASGNITGLTFNGTALILVDSKNDGVTDHKSTLYKLVNPPSGSHTLAFTQNDTWSNTIITAMPFSGVNQLSSINTVSKASGTTTNPSVTVVSGSGELVVDFVHAKGINEAAAFTAGATQTKIGEQKRGFYTSVVSTELGSSSAAMSWVTTLMVSWAQIGVAIKPSVPLPPPPTVTLSANPTSIQLGQSSMLTWSSSNATSVSINQGIGSVAPSGVQSVSPVANIVYVATATGTGGTTTATASVAVIGPPISLTAPSGRTLQLTRQPDNFSALLPLTVKKDDCVTYNGIKQPGGLNCP